MADQLSFLDSQGMTWDVCELGATPEKAVPAEGAHGSGLYFLSRGETRKLRDYPEDWATLPWSGLRALCDRAVPLDAVGGPADLPRARRA